MFVSGLFPKPILCFVLVCGIRVASKSSVDSIPYSKRCPHISMWVLILHDNRECHVNSIFQPACFSSSGSDHFNIHKITSQFFPTLFVSSVPNCLCFPALPPFFLKHSDFLIKYPSYGCEVSSFFSSMFLTGDFSWRCSRSFKFNILFSSPVDSSQAFSVDRILFLVSNAFSCRRIS